MALDEELADAGAAPRRPADYLRECPFLADVPDADVAELAAAALHFSLPAGMVLFESGSMADGLYIVA